MTIKLNTLELAILLDLFKLLEENRITVGPASTKLRKRLKELAAK